MQPADRVVWESVAFEARPFLVACQYRAEPRKTVIVASSYEKCLSWEAKLVQCGIAETDILQLPSGTSALFEDAAPEYSALSARIGALEALIADRPCIVIGAASAVLERTLPRDVLAESFLNLKVGDTLDLDRVRRQLVSLGYEPQEPVRLPGQFSRRGGILDIYVSGYDLPIRIELFGDEVESIRQFDPNSQRSVGVIPALKLSPSRETLYPLEGSENWGAEVAAMVRDSLDRESAILDAGSSARLEELINSDASALEDRVFFDRLDLYRPLLHPDSGCAIDLLPEHSRLILDEPLELESVVSRAEDELGQSLDSRHARGEILHSRVSDFMLPPEHLASHSPVLALTAMNALPEWMDISSRVDVGVVSLAPYRGLA